MQAPSPFFRKKSRLVFLAAILTAAVLVSGATGCSSRGAVPEGERLTRIRRSPQFKDGHFTNALPRWQATVVSILWSWLRGSEHSAPKGELPIVPRTAAEFAAVPQDGLRITWLGHSTVLLEMEGSRFLLDPMWSKRASPFSFLGPKRFHPAPLPLDEVVRLKIDAVVISHDHYDHLDEHTVRELSRRTGARFLVPLGIGAHLERWGIPKHRFREFDWWEEIRIGSVTVTSTPSRHFSGRWITSAWRDSTLWTGWAFRGARRSAYYSGDTAMFPGFKEIGKRLGPFDVTMIEVGQYNPMWPDVHLGPEQAIQAHRDVGGRLLLPVHWSTFELSLHTWTEPMERTLKAARDELRVAAPRPGESVLPLGSIKLARWWPSLPWKTAREVPIVSTGLSPPPQAALQPVAVRPGR